MASPAVSLRKLIKRDPVPCEIIGNHWVHPIEIVDQFVLDAQTREVAKGLEKIQDVSIKEIGVTQAITIGAIALALRDSPEKGAKPVFSSFEEAYANLANKPEATIQIYQIYSDNFDLTPEEKKTSLPVKSSKTI